MNTIAHQLTFQPGNYWLKKLTFLLAGLWARINRQSPWFSFTSIPTSYSNFAPHFLHLTGFITIPPDRPCPAVFPEVLLGTSPHTGHL